MLEAVLKLWYPNNRTAGIVTGRVDNIAGSCTIIKENRKEG